MEKRGFGQETELLAHTPLSQTDVCAPNEELVWSHLSAEGWLCVTRLMSPLQKLCMLWRNDNDTHEHTFCLCSFYWPVYLFVY